jgi:hypothetical protein
MPMEYKVFMDGIINGWDYNVLGLLRMGWDDSYLFIRIGLRLQITDSY